MEFIVAIDGQSPLGQHLLSMHLKIGGASAVATLSAISHPLIVAKDLDWSRSGFVKMTHLQNPDTDNPMPRTLVVPDSIVLLAIEKIPTATPAEQEKPPASLH